MTGRRLTRRGRETRARIVAAAAELIFARGARPPHSRRPRLRLSAVHDLVGVGGVVAALSVTSDLTRGHPPGEAMRACLLATELARRAGLDDDARRDGY